MSNDADEEINEAIDFCVYYLKQAEILMTNTDFHCDKKGNSLVCSPWNFPLGISLGCIIANLLCHNNVLFKPALEASYVGWRLCETLWESGIPKTMLQFIPCDEKITGQYLISHSEIQLINLTGSNKTAEQFCKWNPQVDLVAETGGKNSIILSDLSDQDEAIRIILQSAFGFSGQKCSACSILFCSESLFYNNNFKEKLKQACESLIVGSSTHPGSFIVPLIRKPTIYVEKILSNKKKSQSWLVKPKQDQNQTNIWSPGILFTEDSNFETKNHELFAPLLTVLPIKDVNQGIQKINSLDYGLTSGLISLDEDEHKAFILNCNCGNLYINKPITGAIVSLQPFGGRKKSSFSDGYKAGGPHYLKQFMRIKSHHCSESKDDIKLDSISSILNSVKSRCPDEFERIVTASKSYVFYAKKFLKIKDTHKLKGEHNLSFLEPEKNMVFRATTSNTTADILTVCIASICCKTPINISVPHDHYEASYLIKERYHSLINIKLESDDDFLKTCKKTKFLSIRILDETPYQLNTAAIENHHRILKAPISINGNLECLHYLREKCVSIKSHRFGFISHN